MSANILYKIAFILLFVLPVHLYAQLINGKVTDVKTGTPLENVSVYIAGTQQGTKTDGQGNFKINNTFKNQRPYNCKLCRLSGTKN